METELQKNQPDHQVSTAWSKFADLPHDKQEQMARNVAERVGFSPEEAGYDWYSHPKGILVPLKSISDYDCGGVKSIYLFGSVGAGKTVLLANMVKHLFLTWANGRKCRPEATVPGFVRNVMYLTHRVFHEIVYDFQLERFSVGLDDIARTPYLILDEFGLEGESEKTRSAFESLINHRERFAYPTWIASNVSAAKLKADPTIKRSYSRMANTRWMSYFALTGNLRNTK